jgi:hypothetical protein
MLQNISIDWMCRLNLIYMKLLWILLQYLVTIILRDSCSTVVCHGLHLILTLFHRINIGLRLQIPREQVLQDVLRLQNHGVVPRRLRDVLRVRFVIQVRPVAAAASGQLREVPLRLTRQFFVVSDLKGTSLLYITKIVVTFLHKLLIIQVNRGLRPLLIFVCCCHTLERLSSSHYLRVIAGFKLWRFNMTGCVNITILDNYSTLIS